VDAFGGKGTLRRLALQGSLYEMAGYGIAQVLRLGSNILLTRLLFPRAFGLVALVNIFNQGLMMLSDVGIEPAVIQNPRGDEPAFFNTAWSIQVVRGFALYAVAIAAAWPLSAVYKEPQLLWLTVAGSASVAIVGLHSTSIYTLRRRLAVGKLTLIELGSQVASLVVMIPWAYLFPSVWPLVGGAVASALFKTVASHMLDVGYRNRFAWDPQARAAITHFGKWIFGASAVGFISAQGDRLLLGRFLGVAELGVYSIAVFLSEAASTVITRITFGVLYPILSRIRAQGDARLRDIYYRARLALDALALPALGALTMLGPLVIHILYDKRYAAAGWMLQAFAPRVAMTCILTPCETCLFSQGQTRWGFFRNLARLSWMLVALPIGWHLAGLRGLVWAVALSEVPLFFVLWPPFHRAGLLRVSLEFRAVCLYVAGLLPGWLLARMFHF
jgi:O-antigen/teichoic acid export membrane protein